MMSESTQRFLLIAESFHHGHCVLKVEAIVQQSVDGARTIFLCTAATDGNIAFWEVTAILDRACRFLNIEEKGPQLADLGVPFLTMSVHQSGINSLHIRETKSGHYLVASGGDDNSLHVCLIAIDAKCGTPTEGSYVDPNFCPIDCEPPIKVLKKFAIPSAHAAHVTGLRILRPDLVVSVSVDQRLTLWHLRDDGLHFLCSRFCHVADVIELDTWEADDDLLYYCVFCGQGMEVVTCRLDKDMIASNHIQGNL